MVQAAYSWTLPPDLARSLGEPVGSKLLVVLLWAIVFCGAVVSWRRRRDPEDGVDSAKLLFAVAAPWLFLPTAILLAISFIDPLFHRSYVVFSTPAFALLVAYGLLLITRRALLGALVAGLILLAIPALYSDRQPLAKGNLDDIADIVARRTQDGDAVVFFTSGGRRMAALYPETFEHLTDIELDQTPDEAGNFLGKRVTRREFDSRLADVDRLWIVVRIQKPLPDWMQHQLAENQLTMTADWTVGGSAVLLYERE